jgi:hypothetical protein
MIEVQYLQVTWEHSLSILEQWYNCDGGSNTLKSPALFHMKYTKSFLPLVKELPIFE